MVKKVKNLNKNISSNLEYLIKDEIKYELEVQNTLDT